MTSRTLPEWIGKTPDTAIPIRVQVRVYEHTEGKCQSCGRKVRGRNDWQCDHIQALVNGGENRESNLQVLCGWCHREKTAADVAEKAVTRRKAARHIGTKKRRPGFRGHRKFDGTIVWNERV